MSLLTTFSIMIQIDAKQAVENVNGLSEKLNSAEDSASKFDNSIGKINDTLKKTTQEADKTANALTKADDNAGKTGTGLEGLAGKAGNVIATLAELVGAVAGVFTVSGELDKLGKFSEMLKLNAIEVNAWGNAVLASGGSAEAFQGSIESLSGQLADYSMGTGSEVAETLSMIGISATDSRGQVKSTMSVLPELATAFGNMSNEKSAQLGKKLGLDQGTIMLLQQGRNAVEQLVDKQRKLSGITKEGIENSAKFNTAWLELKLTFQGMNTQATTKIIPIFTKILESVKTFIDFIRGNQPFVLGFLGAIATFLVAKYLPAIIAIARAQWIAAASTFAMYAPIAALVAIVLAVSAAIGLLVDDIYNFVQGNDSMIGRLVKKWTFLGDIIEVVKKIIKSLQNKWEEVVEAFRKGNLIEYLVKEWKDVFSGFVNWIINRAMEMIGGIVGIVTDIITSENPWETFKGYAVSAIDSIKTTFQEAVDWIIKLLNKPKEAIDDLKKVLVDKTPDMFLTDKAIKEKNERKASRGESEEKQDIDYVAIAEEKVTKIVEKTEKVISNGKNTISSSGNIFTAGLGLDTIKLSQSQKAEVSETFDGIKVAIKDIAAELKKLFQRNSLPLEVVMGASIAHKQVSMYSSNELNSFNSNAISSNNKSVSKTNNIKIGGANIYAQSASAEEIKKQYDNSNKKDISFALAHFNDGTE